MVGTGTGKKIGKENCKFVKLQREGNNQLLKLVHMCILCIIFELLKFKVYFNLTVFLRVCGEEAQPIINGFWCLNH